MHRLYMNPSKNKLNPLNDADLASKTEGPGFF